MAGPVDSGLLREAVVYLAAAVVFVPLFTRLRLGAVLGYLVGGILIGPSVLGLISDPVRALHFSEFGVVMLLFVVGLELNPRRLWSLRRNIFGLGTLQVLGCGIALTGALLVVSGFTWQAALVVGLALALSSTALGVQILQEQQKINTPLGERILSVLLLQDIAIVPLLLVVGALSRTPGPEAQIGGWHLLGISLLAIGGLVLAGRFLINPLFRVLAMTGAREVFVVGALLMVVGASFLMASLGLSMAMGAFIAGVMLADSPWRHEVEADVEPFRGLFLGLFFMAVGMTLDMSVVLAQPLRIFLFALGLMLIKFVVVGVLARIFGSSWRDAAITGVFLSQGGEIAFIVLAAATAGMLILPEGAALFTAVVTLSMALTIPALAFLNWILVRQTRDNHDDLEGPGDAPPATVIVMGYGRFGQIVSQLLHARGLDVMLIDTKPAQIEESRKFGWKVYYGDGFRPDVLRAAGAQDARMLVVTTGGAWDPHRLDAVRQAFPHLVIVARAHDREHYMRLVSADLDLVVRELFHSALELGRMALRELGEPDAKIEAVTAEYVRRDRERLELQVASGDITAGSDTVFRPGKSWKPESADTSLGEIPPA